MDDRTFRQAMGRFATGITVITTEVDGQVHGMTANAFMSVSLDPKLVLVSIDKKAQMHMKMRQTKKYAVSILGEDQQQYSMIFAGQVKEHEEVSFARLNDQPVLDKALLTLTCDVHTIHEAGDHLLFIGKVTAMEWKEGKPLLFYNGQYRTITC